MTAGGASFRCHACLDRVGLFVLPPNAGRAVRGSAEQTIAKPVAHATIFGSVISAGFAGRGGGIRTHDLFVPKPTEPPENTAHPSRKAQESWRTGVSASVRVCGGCQAVSQAAGQACAAREARLSVDRREAIVVHVVAATPRREGRNRPRRSKLRVAFDAVSIQLLSPRVLWSPCPKALLPPRANPISAELDPSGADTCRLQKAARLSARVASLISRDGAWLAVRALLVVFALDLRPPG